MCIFITLHVILLVIINKFVNYSYFGKYFGKLKIDELSLCDSINSNLFFVLENNIQTINKIRFTILIKRVELRESTSHKFLLYTVIFMQHILVFVNKKCKKNIKI